MGETIKFETVLHRSGGEPENCNLCDSRPALLHYLVQSDDGISEILFGYCCRVCAVNLLEALVRRQVAGLKKAMNVEALA